MSGTVVTVNMVGAMIRLNGCMFYMCPCCTGLRVYAGDGSDFDACECPCWQFGGARSASIAAFNSRTASAVGFPHSSTYLCQHPTEEGQASVGCLVCGAKSTCPRAPLVLPEASERRYERLVVVV